MLYYHILNLSKEIDPAESNSSKDVKCATIAFLNSVCNGCHDLMVLFLNISYIAI